MKTIFVLSFNIFFVFSSIAGASCLNGSTHENQAGTIFTCDTSYPALGEAYRLKNGKIWGSPVRTNGTLVLMSEGQAEHYCSSIGANLPTRSDYLELILDLKNSYYVKNNVTPMLPDLMVSEWFWTSSEVNGPSYGPDQYNIVGINGPHGNMEFVMLFMSKESKLAVRCMRKSDR